MNHPVICARHGGKFVHGTTRVYRLVIFNFCDLCWTRYGADCERIMKTVASRQSSVVSENQPASAAAAAIRSVVRVPGPSSFYRGAQWSHNR